MTESKKIEPSPFKGISRNERLIFALDVSTVEEAKEIVERLDDSVVFYKLGLQIFMSGGYFELLQWLQERDKKIFADLKFFDVPQTVKSAVGQLRNKGIEFVTVHGNDSILEAAVANKGDVKILAVTVLTSLDDGDIRDLGFACNVEELVLSRAKRALQIGCAGVISSGLEAARLRQFLGDRFLVITPGIRPVQNNLDDQKRTVDVREAFKNGADYIVVGRPIKDAPDPKRAAEDIQKTIAELFHE